MLNAIIDLTHTIVGQDRDTHSFLENNTTSQYAWNSASIDDMEIPRCATAVGCHFKFPIDVELSDTPTINCADHSTLNSYLQNMSNDSNFLTSVLQILIEGRRSAHCT